MSDSTEHQQPNPQAILFDLDGTLVDTAPDFFEVVNQCRQLVNKTPLDHEVIRKQVSNGGSALTRLAFEIADDDADFMARRNQLLDMYADYLGTASSMFSGFRATLDEMELLGIRWAIVTNKPRRFTEPLLAALGLDQQVFVCADDVPVAKPAPDSLFKAAELLAVKPENCWYVGDHLRDIQAARNAGMFSIAALFGYIEDHDDPAQWQADAMISRPDQLLTLL